MRYDARTWRGLRVLGLVVAVGGGLLGSTKSWAIPAFARIYDLKCGACHSAYPALNANGEEFRLSGYRTYAGGAAVPKVAPVKIGEHLELPGVVPISVSLEAGYNYTGLENTYGDGTKNGENTDLDDDFRSNLSSFNLSEAEFLIGAPFGSHLSVFMDFAIGETELRSFHDPEVRGHGTKYLFEGPEIPEQAFVTINNIGGTSCFNIKAGIFELPTAFSAGSRRLSVSPFLVYNTTAFDVISRRGADHFIVVPGKGEEDIEHEQFRLGNKQVGIELFGRENISLGGSLDWFAGAVNGDNVNADNNKTKDFYGRVAYTQKSGNASFKFGGTGYYSGNTLDTLTTNEDTTLGYNNRIWRAGPDFQFTLEAPTYFSVFTQFLFAQDRNATGFGEKARYRGGFLQAELKPSDNLIVYGRYDWIDGDTYDDTGVTINGASGSLGEVDPKLWDAVFGIQYYLWDNYKLIGEYRRGVKELSPDMATAEQLEKTEEDSIFAGFRLVF